MEQGSNKRDREEDASKDSKDIEIIHIKKYAAVADSNINDDNNVAPTTFSSSSSTATSTSPSSAASSPRAISNALLKRVASTVVVSSSPIASKNNPEPQPIPHMSLAGSAGQSSGDRIVLVMVGLPATGKTFIARRLRQYLRFFHGAMVEVFNVGNYRRKRVGAKTPNEFFDPSNSESAKTRQELAAQCMDDLKAWLVKEDENQIPKVAIYDATNTTFERRAWIMKELEGIVESKRHVVFIESVCQDPVIIEQNIVATKLKMPDYENIPSDAAVADFRKRIEHYAKVYQPMSEEDEEAKDLSFIRIVNAGNEVTMHKIRGYLQGRTAQFLLSLHILTRPIYLTRHGESEYNKLGKIGGDSYLSPAGEEYATALAKYVHREILGLNEDGSFKDPNHKVCAHARLFTSSLKRTQETAKHIVHSKCDDGWIVMRPRIWRNLDEIYAGVFDGMTYEEIKQVAPEQFAERSSNKLGYRYPRGESYLDVIERLEPIIHEIERHQDPILLVGHQGILRILYSYFMGYERDQTPHVSIPMNTVIKLTPQTYNCEEVRIEIIPPAQKGYDPHSH